MVWLAYAIASSAVYAVTNFVDKYVLENQIRDYRGLAVFTTMVGLVFGCMCWLLAGYPSLFTWDALLVGMTGMCTIWGLALYFRALATEETSTVIILMQMVPVITVLLSAVFLHETLTGMQIAGFMLIIAAVVGMYFKPGEFRIRPNAALLFISLASALWGVANVIFKFVASTGTFLQLMAFESLGIAAGGLVLVVLFPSVRAAFALTTRTCRTTAILFIVLNEIFFVTAKLLAYYAISLGPVSLVSVIGSTQVFFGILFGWLLTRVTVKLFNEDISASGIFKKITLSVMVFVGIWFMQF